MYSASRGPCFRESLRPPTACDVILGLHFFVAVVFGIFVIECSVEWEGALWHVEPALNKLLAHLGEALLAEVAELQELGFTSV